MPPARLLHQAKVLLHRSAGREFHRLVLEAPALARQSRPGQFVMLRVSDNLDPLLARPFGIAAVVRNRTIDLYYRIVGRGTALLAAARPGSVLSVQGPLGNGFSQPGRAAVPVLVSGGSGFPPLLFFASSLGSRPHLFFGARTRDCLPPARVMKECGGLAQKVYIATDDGSAGRAGLVTDLLAPFLRSSPERERMVVYACGPRPMLAAVAGVAGEYGVPCLVSMEERMACGLGVCMGCSVPVKEGGYARVCKEGPVFDAQAIDWSEHIALPVPKLRR